MKILFVAATNLEIQPLLTYLEKQPFGPDFFTRNIGNHQISALITGVGSVKTVFGLATFPDIKTFNLLINVGIAGVYKRKFDLATVVEVINDQFGDFGVEHQDKSFQSIFEIGLENPDAFPFNNQKIINKPSDYFKSLPQATSVSFNMVSGSKDTIHQRLKWQADIESMEGASFAYAASCLQIPYIQIRSISNNVEPRDRSNWKMAESIKNLNIEIIKMIEGL